MKRTLQIVALPLSILLLSTIGQAERLSRPATDAYTITHESGVGRLLFHVSMTAPEENVIVRRALLRVPLNSIEFSEGMTLRVHPVTTAWSPGQVSWTTGWSREGGDFDDRLRARAEVSSESDGEAIFDITVIAKEMLEHRMSNYGFILTVDPAEGLGVPARELEDLESMEGATVQLEWRRKPTLPESIES
jgi:hypothetical protein